jgi:NADPH:quinone reductase-like Zn-dependent oxidoreductase
MENMRAVPAHSYGGPDVLRFGDAPRPTPALGEVLIRAAAVNPIDWNIRVGCTKDFVRMPLPFVPDDDVSGVVEAVGPGVSRFNKGDEVYARSDALHGHGAYAQFVVAKQFEAARKPKSIDHVHAATIPVAAVMSAAISASGGSTVLAEIAKPDCRGKDQADRRHGSAIVGSAPEHNR